MTGGIETCHVQPVCCVRYAQRGRVVHAHAHRASVVRALLTCTCTMSAVFGHSSRPSRQLCSVPMELDRGCPATHVGQLWPRPVDHISHFSQPLTKVGVMASAILTSLFEHPPKRSAVSHLCPSTWMSCAHCCKLIRLRMHKCCTLFCPCTHAFPRLHARATMCACFVYVRIF
ncbi:hypothetical protein PanWU01x14_359430 [Parasponia andersonii]|uniref:Uncharacterized protein n=1 Tax=Parasponia andersonii TaxID=3476 RepID=A0A2P5A7Y3_PARAD|nr:hypothetical protein PanWU01x14_359430 [Parasponia andersonii]